MGLPLADRRCVPCRAGAPRLEGAALDALRAELDPAWTVVDGRRLEREYRFPDFARALAFVNRVGAVAEAEDHHPDVFLAWGRVRLVLWTHTIDGLSEADFVLAAKADRALAPS